METLAELREHIQGVIAGIGDEFTEADDDWMPVAFVDGEDGMVVMGLGGDLFANGLRKDILAFYLRHAMVQFKARRYALLLNVHAKLGISPEELDEVHEERRRVEEMDGAEEMLVLVIGDAEQEDCWLARIIRDGITPPTLAEWEQMPGTWEGRFAGLNEEMRAITYFVLGGAHEMGGCLSHR